MDTVELSPEYEVAIPRRVRDRLRLQPGQQVQVFVFDDRIELLPIRAAHHLRGFAGGIDTRVDRDTR